MFGRLAYQIEFPSKLKVFLPQRLVPWCENLSFVGRKRFLDEHLSYQDPRGHRRFRGSLPRSWDRSRPCQEYRLGAARGRQFPEISQRRSLLRSTFPESCPAATSTSPGRDSEGAR